MTDKKMNRLERLMESERRQMNDRTTSLIWEMFEKNPRYLGKIADDVMKHRSLQHMLQGGEPVQGEGETPAKRYLDALTKMPDTPVDMVEHHLELDTVGDARLLFKGEDPKFFEMRSLVELIGEVAPPPEMAGSNEPNFDDPAWRKNVIYLLYDADWRALAIKTFRRATEHGGLDPNIPLEHFQMMWEMMVATGEIQE